MYILVKKKYLESTIYAYTLGEKIANQSKKKRNKNYNKNQ